MSGAIQFASNTQHRDTDRAASRPSRLSKALLVSGLIGLIAWATHVSVCAQQNGAAEYRVYGEVQLEVPKSHGGCWAMAFSPGGRTLAIARELGTTTELLDVQSGEREEPLTFDFGKGISIPAFSPDLTRIAYVRNFKPVVTALQHR